MSEMVTVELPPKLADWVKTTVEKTGLPPSEVICNQLTASLDSMPTPRFMRLSGIVKGTIPDLSRRKGFDRG